MKSRAPLVGICGVLIAFGAVSCTRGTETTDQRPPREPADASVVLLHGNPAELLTPVEFVAHSETTGAFTPHTTYYINTPSLYSTRAVERTLAGDERARSLSLQEATLLGFVADGFSASALTNAESPIVRMSHSGQSRNRLRWFETTMRSGPFGPEVAAILDVYGVPDAVFEEVWGEPILPEDRAALQAARIFAWHPDDLLGWDRREGVLHPSWADYQISFTTPDGGSTGFRDFAPPTLNAYWIYKDKHFAIDERVTVLSFRTGLSEAYWAFRIEPDDWRISHPDRYAEVQQALRPRSLLGDAVYALLEAELAEAEAGGTR